MWKVEASSTQLCRDFESSKEMSFDEVVGHPDLRETLKSPPIELLTWIANPADGGHLEELLDLALFETDRGRENNYRMSHNSVNLLQIEDKSLQSRIFANNIFHAKLNQFTKEKTSYRHPVLAGHFSRLFVLFLSFTRGGMLARYADVIDLLIANIDILAHADLLDTLIRTYTKEVSAVKPIKDILLDLIAKLEGDEPVKFSVACTLRTFSDIEDIPIRDQEIITRMLEMAVRMPDDSLGMRVLFSTLNSLLSNDKPDWAKDVEKEYAKEIKFDGKNPTAKMIAAFPVFAELVIDDMIDYFFNRDEHDEECLLAFRAVFEKMSSEDLDAFVERHRIAEKLMAHPEAFQPGNTNALIPLLGIFVKNKCGKGAPSIVANEDWDLFLAMSILPREAVIQRYRESLESDVGF